MLYRKVPKFTAPERIDNFAEVSPSDIPKLPGMISEAEGRYLRSVTRREDLKAQIRESLNREHFNNSFCKYPTKS